MIFHTFLNERRFFKSIVAVCVWYEDVLTDECITNGNAYNLKTLNMTTVAYSPQEQQSVRFFTEIKKHLGLRSSHKLVMLLRAVLSNIRRGLSDEEAKVLVKELPNTFRLFFFTNWRCGEKTATIAHLDELVDNIYKEDKKTHNALFTSEIDTLNTVILVLHKLDRFFGILQLNVFRYSLTQELKQAAIEEAV